MASNNTGSCSPSNRLSSQSKEGLIPVPEEFADHSDDSTLLALSSLTKMEEATRSTRLDHSPEESSRFTTKSASPDLNDSTDCLDVVQQAINAVEDALLHCSRNARHQALSELLTHVKLEQARQASQAQPNNLDHGDVWAAMLQHVQGLGHDYPKDPQVHQLVFLVQQCVTKGRNYEIPEDDEDHTSPQQLKAHQEKSDNSGGVAIQHGLEEDGTVSRGWTEEAVANIVMGSYGDEVGHPFTSGISEGEAASNQTEDDADSPLHSPSESDDHDKSLAQVEMELEGYTKPLEPSPRLRPLLPIMTGNVAVKGIQEPRPPRGGFGSTTSNGSYRPTVTPNPSVGNGSRLKFQFPESELNSAQDGDAKRKSVCVKSPGLNRRVSTSHSIACVVPLRRKSFSMKRSSLKSAPFPGVSPMLADPSSIAMGTSKPTSPGAAITGKHLSRRKSSISYQVNTNQALSRRNSRSLSITHQICTSKKNAANSPNKDLSDSLTPPPSPQPSTQTQMVLRVRERTSDGVPQLVITKKPVRCVVWHWNDRRIRVPFMNSANFIELGPAQHGIMLKQLRYVKSTMHDLPWAKAHLRALLSKYTAKDVTKEQLYPQLNALGHQVQQELGARAKEHRSLTARKQRLTVTLTIATGVVNDTLVTKFGRRGRPHASRLIFDPTNPLQLRWRRKHGERSSEFLAVDEIEVAEVPDTNNDGGHDSFGRGNKKAAAAVAVDPETCLSLITPSRSLDLQVASALHREWLANAVREIVSFAQQFKASRSHAGNAESTNTTEPMANSSDTSRRPR